MARVTKIVPPELGDLLLGLARTAKRRNKALELNGSDIEYAPGLARRLATACSKAGCMVSLGSDAHYPREVFRNMRIAMNLVDSLKLKL
jgi:histidinol phosphatase-like PHP family hydrolase